MLDEMNQLIAIYGERNQSMFPDLRERMAFLQERVRKLEDAYRKKQAHRFPEVLASIFARWVAVVEMIDCQKLLIVLCAKFGDGCPYCPGKIPCECKDGARQPAVLRPSKKPLDWSLRGWQWHLDNVYGDKNREEGGVWFVLTRLFSELTEVDNEWLQSTLSGVIDERRVAEELAEVFAWIIAMANILDVDISLAVTERYRNGCPKCGRSACGCGNLLTSEMEFLSK